MSNFAVQGLKSSVNYIGPKVASASRSAYSSTKSAYNSLSGHPAILQARSDLHNTAATGIAAGISSGVTGLFNGIGNGLSTIGQKIGLTKKGGDENYFDEDNIFSDSNKTMVGGGTIFHIIRLMFIVILLLFALYIVKTQYNNLFGSSKMTNSINWVNGRNSLH